MKPQTWDELLAGHSPAVQVAARELEAVLREEFSDAIVRFDPGNGLLALGRTMAMRDLTFAVIPHAGWVNLQLADGAELPNPDGLIEGTGKRIRHVKVRSAAVARDPRVTATIRAQVAARQG